MTSCMCAGIDVDIDVEHDGQKTKGTPPPQSGGEGEDMEMGGANSETCGEGGATATGGTTQESKVSSRVTDSSHKFFSSLMHQHRRTRDSTHRHHLLLSYIFKDAHNSF